VVKIDRGLAEPPPNSQSTRRIVSGTVEIGLALEIEIIAKGVKTGAHVRIAASLCRNRLQRLRFARAMAAADLETHLRAPARPDRPGARRAVASRAGLGYPPPLRATMGAAP
jgi:EAL domain-containing protein (putative c-di-GMP-specific phosphodiesterase class I)